MKLITMTEVLSKTYGMEKALTLIKEAGFDGADLSLQRGCLDEGGYFGGDDYLEKAKALRAFADEIGLAVLQAHSPYPTYKTDNKEFNDYVFNRTLRAIEVCGIMGAEILVVHPFQHFEYFENRDWLFDENIKFYSKLSSFAQNHGVKIATENMFVTKEKITPSVCGTPDEYLKYMNELEKLGVTACLDIGHCILSANTQPEDFIKIMADKIGCLHVHDNDLINDRHLLPYMGKLNWDNITSALRGINYRGNFTFEIDKTFALFPTELYPSLLKFMEQVGRHLISKIEDKNV